MQPTSHPTTQPLSAARLEAEEAFSATDTRLATPSTRPPVVTVIKRRLTAQPGDDRAALAGAQAETQASAETPIEASKHARVFLMDSDSALLPANRPEPASARPMHGRADAAHTRSDRDAGKATGRSCARGRRNKSDPGKVIYAAASATAPGVGRAVSLEPIASDYAEFGAQGLSALAQALAEIGSTIEATRRARSFSVVDPSMASEWARLSRTAIEIAQWIQDRAPARGWRLHV